MLIKTLSMHVKLFNEAENLLALFNLTFPMLLIMKQKTLDWHTSIDIPQKVGHI